MVLSLFFVSLLSPSFLQQLGSRHSAAVLLGNSFPSSFLQSVRLGFPFMATWICQLAITATVFFFYRVRKDRPCFDGLSLYQVSPPLFSNAYLPLFSNAYLSLFSNVNLSPFSNAYLSLPMHICLSLPMPICLSFHDKGVSLSPSRFASLDLPASHR